MCRVTKSCVLKLLQNLENSLQNYPENPGNCVSGIPDYKIFPGEHAPRTPLDTSRLRHEIVPPNFNALAPPLLRATDCRIFSVSYGIAETRNSYNSKWPDTNFAVFCYCKVST